MHIVNRHKRTYPVTAAQIAPLLDALGTSEDRLWPRRTWPPMVLSPTLVVGAEGGHGPIKYLVTEYRPGESAVFSFTNPKGWTGTHRFEITALEPQETQVAHTLDMEATGAGLLKWLVIFRPLHDALIEEALDRIGAHFGVTAPVRSRPRYVRFLRWLLKPRPAR